MMRLGWALWQEGDAVPGGHTAVFPAFVRLTVLSRVSSRDPSLPFSPMFNEHDLLGRCFETM